MTDHRDRPSHAEILRRPDNASSTQVSDSGSPRRARANNGNGSRSAACTTDSVTDAVSASAGLTAFSTSVSSRRGSALPDLRGHLPPHAIDQRPPDIGPIVARNPQRAARQLKRAAAPDEALWRLEARRAIGEPRALLRGARDRRARSNGGSRTIARGSGQAPSVCSAVSVATSVRQGRARLAAQARAAAARDRCLAAA